MPDLQTIAIPFPNLESAKLGMNIINELANRNDIREAFKRAIDECGDTHETREHCARFAADPWRDSPETLLCPVPNVKSDAVVRLAFHAVLIMWFGHLPNSPTGILPKHPADIARERAERN